jgi:outer membrane protein, multidrug efflux system
MMTRALLTCAACLALAGCAIGPEAARPAFEAPPPEQWTAQADEPGPTLAEALTRNNDLDAATGRVLEAQAMLGGSKSALLPTVSVGAAASRSKTSSELTSPLFSPYNNNFSVTGTVLWEADLWGKLRRGKEASAANLMASEEERRAFAQSLIANVTLTWLQVKELQLQVDLNERTVASYNEHLTTVGDRYERGLVSSLDFRLARQNLAGAQASGPPLKQNLVTARRRLEILAGRYPSGAILTAPVGIDKSARDDFFALPRPLDPVPAGLPSELLDRRPDLLAAEARLNAATASIGQAKAALYPKISLTADGGSKTRELANLFTSPTEAWSLVGNLFMPILNRGATQAQIKAAEARTVQAVANYRSAVLQAFAEVENALDEDRNLTLQEEFLVDSVLQARHSVTLAEDRYARGLDNILTALDTQRRLYSAESQLLSVQRARQAARVTLILALGGPWADEKTIANLNEGADQ